MNKEEEERKKMLWEYSVIILAKPITHPTIVELVEVLGYGTMYDALKAAVKEKGLWKEEWNEK